MYTLNPQAHIILQILSVQSIPSSRISNSHRGYIDIQDVTLVIDIQDMTLLNTAYRHTGYDTGYSRHACLDIQCVHILALGVCHSQLDMTSTSQYYMYHIILHNMISTYHILYDVLCLASFRARHAACHAVLRPAPFVSSGRSPGNHSTILISSNAYIYIYV